MSYMRCFLTISIDPLKSVKDVIAARKLDLLYAVGEEFDADLTLLEGPVGELKLLVKERFEALPISVALDL